MLEKLTIEEIGLGIKKKEFSYTDLLNAYEVNFKKYACLNAVTDEFWEEAKQSAKNLANKEHSNPLQGVCISIKDIFLMKGKKTTVASEVLKNFVAPYESHVTQNLHECGALMPFKTNLDEFAMGSSNQTSCFGAVINPWITQDRVLRVPGGSSGGSAASVASHMCVGSLGTDTAGSVRQPAAFCGIVGLKGTYGRCSRRGVVAFASSLDHPGVLARTVQDACYIFEGIAGYDDADSTSLDMPVPQLSKTLSTVKGKTIGVAFEYFDKLNDEYTKHVNNLIENLKKEGAVIKEITLPSLEMALRLYYIIAPAEAASNFSRYNGHYSERGNEGSTFEEIMLNSREKFGTEVKRRILIGNYVLFSDEYQEYFGKAYRMRTQIQHEMDAMFDDIDAMLMPTTPNGAFALDAPRETWEMYHEDLYTVLANIYGGPAIQVPLCKVASSVDGKRDSKFDVLPTQDGLPMGIQIMAKRCSEIPMIETAKKIEEIVAWEAL